MGAAPRGGPAFEKLPKPHVGGSDAAGVVAALGQRPDTTSLGGVAVDAKRGVVRADEVTLETSLTGVFACGDVVLGPDIAVTAIAAGRRAAISVDRLLRGEDLRAGREAPSREKATRELRGVVRRPRRSMRTIPLGERRTTFRELELGYAEEEARTEASRIAGVTPADIAVLLVHLKRCHTQL